jgi:serine/threonine protein kinase
MPDTPDEERLAGILGDWLERRDRGEAVPPEEVIRTHPDVAEALGARFRALGVLGGALAKGLPEGAPAAIGDFRLVREIGRGGMGVVYEAEQTSMRRRVALKVLSVGIAGTSHAVKRFQREAQVAGRLHHTNIVPVYAMGQHGGQWYYAMELIRGRPLDEVIAEARARGRASSGAGLAETGDRSYFVRAAEMFAGVAEALHLAHQEDTVHRDIKPSNLMLDDDGFLKIVDFGIARYAHGDSLTLTGGLLGTPVYMSPEQAAARGVEVDQRTDVYSLGATIYETVTLSPPFEGRTLQEVCSQIVTQDPAPPRR